jgi:hypothetical protein
LQLLQSKKGFRNQYPKLASAELHTRLTSSNMASSGSEGVHFEISAVRVFVFFRAPTSVA